MGNSVLTLDNILKVTKEASRAGAEVLRSYFGRVAFVQEKPDSSIVSEADRESERVIREILTSHYPQFAIHGEEGGLVEATAEHEGTWHIDPLDGTTNFVHGFPYFSTSLALEVQEQVVVAVVDAPALNLSFWGTRGGGAFMNGTRLKVKERAQLSECLLATGFSYEREKEREYQLRLFAHFLGKSRGVRRPGAAALDLCYTAAGVFDGFWEKYLKNWDMAAGALLVEEAGGVISSLDGSPWTTATPSILAGSPSVHKLLKKEIASKI